MFNRKLLTIVGFKIVWLNCILGEIYINSLFGLYSGIIFLIIFILFIDNKLIAIKVISFFSISGYIFDSLLSYFNFYSVDAQINIFFLPIWFLVLWPSFCCLLVEVLAFLKKKFFISTFLGLFVGPLTYYAGISTNLAVSSGIISFLLISFYWSLMMFVYSKFF